MIKILRKIFLIDFVLSMLRSKQSPHIRFAGFLQVFSFLWMALAILLLASVFNTESHTRSGSEWTLFAFWLISCVGFFFFYRYTSRILKGYSEEEALRFSYLRYLNPVAPVIYFTTVFLLVLAIVNFIMLLYMIMATLAYFLGVLVSFGLLLLDDTYKLKNFIGVPNAFFNAEEYFLEHIIGPEVIIAFMILIYFIIPVGASLTILWQHSKRKTH